MGKKSFKESLEEKASFTKNRPIGTSLVGESAYDTAWFLIDPKKGVLYYLDPSGELLKASKDGKIEAKELLNPKTIFNILSTGASINPTLFPANMLFNNRVIINDKGKITVDYIDLLEKDKEWGDLTKENFKARLVWYSTAPARVIGYGKHAQYKELQELTSKYLDALEKGDKQKANEYLNKIKEKDQMVYQNIKEFIKNPDKYQKLMLVTNPLVGIPSLAMGKEGVQKRLIIWSYTSPYEIRLADNKPRDYVRTDLPKDHPLNINSTFGHGGVVKNVIDDKEIQELANKLRIDTKYKTAGKLASEIIEINQGWMTGEVPPEDTNKTKSGIPYEELATKGALAVAPSLLGFAFQQYWWVFLLISVVLFIVLFIVFKKDNTEEQLIYYLMLNNK